MSVPKTIGDRFVRIDTDKLSATIDGLNVAFRWNESAEGHDFWKGIFVRLSEILERRRSANQGTFKACREMIFYDLYDKKEHEAAANARYRESRRERAEERKKKAPKA